MRLEIIDLQKKHILKLIKMSNQVLGKDYLRHEDLEKAIDSEEYMCKIVRNIENRAVIGFCLYQIVTPEALPVLLKLPESKIPSALRHSERIGVIKTAAIAVDYQSCGIGKKLIDECHQRLLKSNVQSVCSVAWKYGGRANIGGILGSLGFIEYIEIENYWRDDSLKNGYTCPICGKPPCMCSAVIYTYA